MDCQPTKGLEKLNSEKGRIRVRSAEGECATDRAAPYPTLPMVQEPTVLDQALRGAGFW